MGDWAVGYGTVIMVVAEEGEVGDDGVGSGGRWS